METRQKRFNQILSGLLVLLFAGTLFAFNYGEWQAETEHHLWMTLLNMLILSLPLLLLFGAIYLLASAGYEYRLTGAVNPRLGKAIRWAPRIAAIIIIFFITLFSLDVFTLPGTPLQLIGAFIMHSLPSIVMIVALVFAWKRPLIGAVAFLLAGMAFMRFLFPGFNIGNLLLFCLPLWLVAALFYLDWRWKQPEKTPAALA